MSNFVKTEPISANDGFHTHDVQGTYTTLLTECESIDSEDEDNTTLRMECQNERGPLGGDICKVEADSDSYSVASWQTEQDRGTTTLETENSDESRLKFVKTVTSSKGSNGVSKMFNIKGHILQDSPDVSRLKEEDQSASGNEKSYINDEDIAADSAEDDCADRMLCEGEVSRRRRQASMTEEQLDRLLSGVEQFQPLLAIPNPDLTCKRKKAVAWKIIANKVNDLDGVQWTVMELKDAWKQREKQVRKYMDACGNNSDVQAPAYYNRILKILQTEPLNCREDGTFQQDSASDCGTQHVSMDTACTLPQFESHDVSKGLSAPTHVSDPHNVVKRRRRANMTEEQIDCLLTGVSEYHSLLTSPHPDIKFRRRKAGAWKVIASRVNSCDGVQWTVAELKDAWKNRQQQVRKYVDNYVYDRTLRPPPYCSRIMKILKISPKTDTERARAQHNRCYEGRQGRVTVHMKRFYTMQSSGDDTKQSSRDNTSSQSISNFQDSRNSFPSTFDGTRSDVGDGSKRKRRANMTEEQVDCLLKGVEEYHSVLKVSDPDSTLRQVKAEAWKTIVDRVNKCDGVKWTVTELKYSLKNRERQVRLYMEAHRQGQKLHARPPPFCKRIMNILQMTAQRNMTDRPATSDDSVSEDTGQPSGEKKYEYSPVKTLSDSAMLLTKCGSFTNTVTYSSDGSKLPDDGENTERGRLTSMSMKQVDCLLKGVEEYQSLLLISYPDDMFAQEKEVAWKDVTAKVNSCEGTHWSVHDIREAWAQKRRQVVNYTKASKSGHNCDAHPPLYYNRVLKINQNTELAVLEEEAIGTELSQDISHVGRLLESARKYCETENKSLHSSVSSVEDGGSHIDADDDTELDSQKSGPEAKSHRILGPSNDQQLAKADVSFHDSSIDDLIGMADETSGDRKFKRKRRSNMTLEQVECLVKGVEENQSVILASDSNSKVKKERVIAWKDITNRINSYGGIPWTVTQVRDCWRIRKRQAQQYSKACSAMKSSSAQQPMFYDRIIKLLHGLDKTSSQKSTTEFDEQCEGDRPDDAEKGVRLSSVENSNTCNTQMPGIRDENNSDKKQGFSTGELTDVTWIKQEPAVSKVEHERSAAVPVHMSQRLQHKDTDEIRSLIEHRLKNMTTICQELQLYGVETKVLVLSGGCVLSCESDVTQNLSKILATQRNAALPPGIEEDHAEEAALEMQESSSSHSHDSKPWPASGATVDTVTSSYGDSREERRTHLSSDLTGREEASIEESEDCSASVDHVRQPRRDDLSQLSDSSNSEALPPFHQSPPKAALQSEMFQPEADGVQEKDESTKLCCEVCGKLFTEKGKLANHRRRHKTERVTCDICGKSFANIYGLQLHKERHAGIVKESVMCDVCGQKFSTKFNLKHHLRIHTGEKPYSCKYCKQSFTFQGQLTFHLATHTGYRPHRCEICGKGFVQAARLRYHQTIHNTEKIFQCQLCSKAFHSKYSLADHRRTHFNQHARTCHECGKCLKSPHSLHIHMRLHTGEKPYTCDICGEKFSRSDVLFQHKKKHEGNSC